MRKLYSCILSGAVAGLMASEGMAAEWTTKDLELLNQKGQHVEILEKADHVPPSARDGKWENVTMAAFDSYAQKKLSGDSGHDSIAQLLNYVEKYPHFENATKAVSLLSRAVMDQLKKCMTFGYWQICTKNANVISVFKSTSAKEIWAMAEVVASSDYPGQSLSLMRKAFEKGADKKLCSNHTVNLALRFGGKNPDDGIYSDFKKVGFDYCPDQLNKDLIGDLTSTEKQMNAMCPDLLKFKKVSGVLKSKCERIVK